MTADFFQVKQFSSELHIEVKMLILKLLLMSAHVIKHYVSVFWKKLNIWTRQLRICHSQKFLPNLTTFQTLSMKYSKSKVSELRNEICQTQTSEKGFGKVIKNNGGREIEHKRRDDLLLFPRGAPNLSWTHSVPETRWDGMSPPFMWDLESLLAHWFWNQTVATANQGNKTARIQRLNWNAVCN